MAPALPPCRWLLLAARRARSRHSRSSSCCRRRSCSHCGLLLFLLLLPLLVCLLPILLSPRHAAEERSRAAGLVGIERRVVQAFPAAGRHAANAVCRRHDEFAAAGPLAEKLHQRGLVRGGSAADVGQPLLDILLPQPPCTRQAQAQAGGHRWVGKRAGGRAGGRAGATRGM